MLRQHTYGSGEISFAPFLPNTQTPGALRYLGNTPEFTLSTEQETLDHYDTDHGLRIKDDSVVTQLDRSGTLVTDNINYDNLAMFFLGTSSTIALTSATGTVDTIANVGIGTYQLGVTSVLPTGRRHVAAVVVATGVTTFVAGTDYVVDAVAGTINILEEGAIVAGTTVTVTYNSAANVRQHVIASNETKQGKLHFKAFNPVGPKTDYTLPWVKLTPNGDFSLKGEDWLTMPFTMEVLKKGDLAPIYADGVAVTS